MTPGIENRLAREASPYLRQHARNPVDWYPWGDEAFERARVDDKPIFLSVGYAACHWCHVMERESFEDPATAKRLNASFVAIKVDREERPDVDAVYMTAVQTMTGSGGWPMSVWLTPDGEPFYAGTYFPPVPRHGLPSFGQLLDALAGAWRERRGDIREQAGQVAAVVTRVTGPGARAGNLGSHVLDDAVAAIMRAADERHGGFGSAPKFPQPMVLEVLLRRAASGDDPVLPQVVLTLDRMSAGGMFDQVGGGFARYSVDAAWHVPHFEKMLYDNAQLARCYTDGWLATGEDRFRVVAERTFEFLVRDLRQGPGGFSSSLDADTGGVEGATATWTWNELVGLVGRDTAEALGASAGGNWEGTNVLRAPPAGVDIGDAFATLFAVRRERPQPPLDDKVVTAWNALAVRAFADASRAFGVPAYLDVARDAAAFVLDEMRTPDGRLRRSWRDGVAGPAGFADDHALMAVALVRLFEASGEVRWLDEAFALAEVVLTDFADPGGTFQSATAELLLTRPRDLDDDATPSGNAAVADALLRLWHLGGDPRFEEAATNALSAVAGTMGTVPFAHGYALCVLDSSFGPARQVAIVGDSDDPATRALVGEVDRRYLPNTTLAVAAPDDAETIEKVSFLRGRPQVSGLSTAYVCEGFACSLPVTTADALGDLLEAEVLVAAPGSEPA